jgi:hypothetical protein
MKNIKKCKLKTIIMLIMIVSVYSSCKPKCKYCHTEINGIKSPPQELCGEQLIQAEQTAGMVCEDEK